MSRQNVALNARLRTARCSWRPFTLGMLIVFTLAVACALLLHGSDRAEHAGIVICWVLVGMLGLGSWVCRR